jgi:hypothetical protein
MKLNGLIFLPFVVHFPGNVNGRYNFPAAVSEGLKKSANLKSIQKYFQFTKNL